LNIRIGTLEDALADKQPAATALKSSELEALGWAAEELERSGYCLSAHAVRRAIEILEAKQ
jgi:hypothetical protein